MPRVSLILPTYNGARYLPESIDSCLRQTFVDFELIVVVDGSTDDTEKILTSYSDSRMQIVRQSNQGLPLTLNAGFACARGEYWSWTSDDNFFLPDALQVMVDYLDTHSRAPMVCTDILRIDQAGRTRSYDDSSRACFLYRADVARQVGEYRHEYRLVEDTDFFLRLQHIGGLIERIHQPYYCYRDHPSNLSYKQGSKRYLTAMKMRYDHIIRGIEQCDDLQPLFFDLLGKAALYGDHQQMGEMVAFAKDKRVHFLAAFERHEQWLRSPAGWAYNRVRTALLVRYQRLQKRVSRRLKTFARP